VLVRTAGIATRWLGIFVMTALVVMVSGRQPALAHDDDQLDTIPGGGDTVQVVARIVVDFAGPIGGERFEVLDPSGERVEGATIVTNEGVATFAPDTVVTAEGEYTVRYVAQSADGHLVSGEFAFVVGDPVQSGDGASALRWIAGVAAVIATISIAAAATVVRRGRSGAAV
jgi:methionine-rich copper-binding protein CopC